MLLLHVTVLVSKQVTTRGAGAGGPIAWNAPLFRSLAIDRIYRIARITNTLASRIRRSWSSCKFCKSCQIGHNSYFFTFRCWSIEVGTACPSVSPANWNSCNSVIPGEVSTDRSMKFFAFARSIGTQWKETTSFLGIGALPSYTYVQASPRCIAASLCTNRYSPFRVTPWRTTARSKLVTALCLRAVFDALVYHDTEPIIK